VVEIHHDDKGMLLQIGDRTPTDTLWSTASYYVGMSLIALGNGTGDW
jgi:hypothetical protein